MKLIQEGPRDAKILICGESPGRTEVVTGTPFSGGSGELLNRMLSRVGISRDACFITNLCHTQPPGNGFAHFLKKDKAELARGLIQLKDDIDEIKPNLIIALGSQPLRFITGKISVEKWRGSILESYICPGRKVIATYHPAAILRTYEYKVVAEFDLQRCAAEAASPEIRIPEREFLLNPSREQAVQISTELLKAEWLAVDIECFESGSGWRLACVGFSDRADRALVIPCDEPWQLELIKVLCESNVKKVLQNGTFDSTVLAENGIALRNFAWDTMLAHHSIYPECASSADEISQLGGKKRKALGLAKGLAFLVSIHTRQPFYKDDGKLWKQTGDLQLFWRYNGLDNCCTREIRDRQQEDFDSTGLFHVFEYEMSLVQPLMAVTNRGIKVDLKLRQTLKDKYEEEVSNLQAALDHAAGGSFNVKSSKQITDLLYNRLGLPAKYKQRANGKRSITADKDAVIELAGKYKHPVLAIILAIRQHRDFIERYLTAKVDADGRMRCSFDITGTRTWRLSSRQSIYGSGTNLQNIPVRKPAGEAIRRTFVADEGKVLVVRDYKQAESWIVARLSKCERLIELLADPSRDVHSEIAAGIYSIPLSEIDFPKRYLGKRTGHASNYGLKADRLVQMVNEDAEATGIRIDRREAQRLLDGYFLLYPEIREEFWKYVQRELQHSRQLVNPFGFVRTFYGRWDDKLLKEAYSHIPQSTVGILGATALRECVNVVERDILGAETLLNVHDSVMMQCWVKDVEAVAQRMAEVMAIPITMDGKTFVIPSDCKVGSNWGSKKEENPNGLQDYHKWIIQHAA